MLQGSHFLISVETQIWFTYAGVLRVILQDKFASQKVGGEVYKAWNEVFYYINKM